MNWNDSQALQAVMAWAHGSLCAVLGESSGRLGSSKKRIASAVGEYNHVVSANNYYIGRCREWAAALGMPSRELLEANIKYFKELLQPSGFRPVKHRKSLAPELWNKARALQREIAAESAEAKPSE